MMEARIVRGPLGVFRRDPPMMVGDPPPFHIAIYALGRTTEECRYGDDIPRNGPSIVTKVYRFGLIRDGVAFYGPTKRGQE